MDLSKFKEKTNSFSNKLIESRKKYLDSRKKSDFEIKTKIFLKKILQVLKKNYRVATRNPKLYLSLILAPLLFVLLIGMAFNTSQMRSDLKIGIYDETPDYLIYNAFNGLKNVDAIQTQSIDICKKLTLNKEHVVCIIIEETEQESYNIDVYFDYSRMSVYATVYTLVREVFINIEQEMMTAVISELRTQVNPAHFAFDEILVDLEKTEQELMNASKNINLLAGSLSSDSTFYQYKLDEIIKELKLLDQQILSHQKAVTNYKSHISDQRKESEETYSKLKNSKDNVLQLNYCGDSGADLSNVIENSNIVDLINQEENPGCSAIKTIDSISSKYLQSYKNLLDGLIKAERDLEEVYESLNMLRTSNQNYLRELELEKNKITQSEEFYSSEIIVFQNNLVSHTEKINVYNDLIKKLNNDVVIFHSALNPQDIVSKFELNMKLISQTKNMLDYTLHLLIPFILLLSALLLSITLNRNEYKTSAYHRNKMLKNNFLIFSGNTSFILIIMLLELIFILVLFKVLFNSNTLVYLPSVILTSVIFILIWAIIGFIISRYINSDEGAIFSGTILGLIVFFLSDVLVPVENFPTVMLYLYKINPFIYFSEIIRTNYLAGGLIQLFNQNFIYLIIILVVTLSISTYLIWRDMNENVA